MSRYILPEVLLLMLSVRFACAGIHTHYFFTTATNDFTFGIPSYTMTRTLDDVTLVWYDSEDEVVERRVPWFKSPYPTLLDASLNYYSQQKSLENLLRSISDSLNHTEGYHVLQGLQGCTLYDNGTVQASFSYRYDGEPFMSFNVETANWTAETPEAEKFVQIANFNTTILEQNRYLLVNTCIPHITELLALGNCTFNRKEAPVVKVAQMPINNAGVRLYCRAYGHYPKDIFMMWYKNGQQITEKMERVTLPLPHFTFLTSLSIDVPPVIDDVYTCKINHSSMPLDFTQDLRISGNVENLSSAPANPSIGAVIAICLAIVLALVIIVFGSVSFEKSRKQLH